MDEGYKEVRFDEYCKTCEYKDIPDIENPCDECLENPAVLHSCKPINYKEKRVTKATNES